MKRPRRFSPGDVVRLVFERRRELHQAFVERKADIDDSQKHWIVIECSCQLCDGGFTAIDEPSEFWGYRHALSEDLEKAPERGRTFGLAAFRTRPKR